MLFSDAFRAMDTDVDVLVSGPSPRPEIAMSIRLLFEQQEERFSRFRPSSLLSRFNNGSAVDDSLFVRACRMAIEAHEFTLGRFNPMILPALRQAGYDMTFSAIRGGAPERQDVPSPAEALQFEGTSVRLRMGALDLGGLVKGWTVDLAVEQFGRSVEGIFVNAGGDLRCDGREDDGPGWDAAIEGPEGDVAWRGRIDGALATSTTARRRWRAIDGGTVHHLIDPATGLPSASALVQVSAWSRETWRAEVWAKAALIGGDTIVAAGAASGVPFLLCRSDGKVPEYVSGEAGRDR